MLMWKQKLRCLLAVAGVMCIFMISKIKLYRTGNLGVWQG